MLPETLFHEDQRLAEFTDKSVVQLACVVLVIHQFDGRRFVQVIASLVLAEQPGQHDQSATMPFTHRIGLGIDKDDFFLVDYRLHLHAADRHENMLILAA